MPVCPTERSGQPGEKRQGRDRIDRREERSKILADLDQERRHRSYFLIHPSYFFLSCVRCRFKQTADQTRDKETHCIANCLLVRYSLIVSVKEQVLQAINRLPDDIDYRDAADEIAFLAAVGEAERDIEQGRVVSNEQMKARIAEWIGK
jgi:hypothetical protein